MEGTLERSRAFEESSAESKIVTGRKRSNAFGDLSESFFSSSASNNNSLMNVSFGLSELETFMPRAVHFENSSSSFIQSGQKRKLISPPVAEKSMEISEIISEEPAIISANFSGDCPTENLSLDK